MAEKKQTPNDPQDKFGYRTFTEELEVAGNQLMDRTKELIGQGNIRRLIIRYPNGGTLMEIPLTVGAVAAGALVFFNPMLAGLGVVGGLLGRVTIEIVRDVPEGAAVSEFNLDTEDVMERVEPVISDVRKRVDPVVSDVRQRMEPVISDARQKVDTAADDVKRKVEDAVSSARSSVEQAAEDVKSKVEATADDVKTRVQGAADDAENTVDDATTQIKLDADKAKDRLQDSE